MNIEDNVMESLRSVIDPEIGINIVDLGLVYTIDIHPESIQVGITMTSPTCPLHAMITRNAEQVLEVFFPGLVQISASLSLNSLANSHASHP